MIRTINYTLSQFSIIILLFSIQSLYVHHKRVKSVYADLNEELQYYAIHNDNCGQITGYKKYYDPFNFLEYKELINKKYPEKYREFKNEIDFQEYILKSYSSNGFWLNTSSVYRDKISKEVSVGGLYINESKCHSMNLFINGEKQKFENNHGKYLLPRNQKLTITIENYTADWTKIDTVTIIRELYL